jgi:hypothetical protein
MAESWDPRGHERRGVGAARRQPGASELPAEILTADVLAKLPKRWLYNPASELPAEIVAEDRPPLRATRRGDAVPYD